MRDDIVINERVAAMSDQLIEVFENIFDPEIELDVYNLGLLYELHLDEKGHLHVLMTFTDTNCGCADTMPAEIIEKVTQLEGIASADVEVTYNPVWKMTRISRLGRITLGISPRGGK